MWIWVSGTVPEDLNESCPLVLDWSMADLKSKDQAKWPPSNTALSDLVVYKIIAAEVSHRSLQKIHGVHAAKRDSETMVNIPGTAAVYSRKDTGQRVTKLGFWGPRR